MPGIETPPNELSFERDVDWSFADGKWIRTSDNDRHWIGIVQYRVYSNPTTWMKVFDYIVEVETEFAQYVYKFTDGEPDTYSLKFIHSGQHEVMYNSKYPGICKVYGRPREAMNEWSNGFL